MSWDAHINAAARTEGERLAFHLLLTHPETAARLDAILADNQREADRSEPGPEEPHAGTTIAIRSALNRSRILRFHRAVPD